MRAFTGDLLKDVPAWALSAVGGLTGLGVLFWLSIGAVAAGATSDKHWDSYSAGYEKGLEHGVQRALKISPEARRQMEDRLEAAELARL